VVGLPIRDLAGRQASRGQGRRVVLLRVATYHPSASLVIPRHSPVICGRVLGCGALGAVTGAAAVMLQRVAPRSEEEP
jgi:hypothetical protein